MEVFVIINNVGIVNGEWSVDVNGKCRYEWKELIVKEICDKGFIYNHSNYEGKCDKLCDIWEYVDYENCKCRKKLIH